MQEVDVVGIVARRSEVVEDVKRRWDIPVFTSIEDALRLGRPDFVIVAVPRTVAPQIITQVVQSDVAVLSETPPAADVESLRSLWRAVGPSGLVQVAEQYPLYPGHASRLTLVRRGIIGTATSVQVSSTHGYHAVALIRTLLRTGFKPTRVRAATFKAPLLDPISRDGWTDDIGSHLADNVIATIDFGDSAGLYDFTTNQWHNRLRKRRIVVRGSHGEIVDDTVVHHVGKRAIIESPLVRRQTGYDLDLEGYDTDHVSFEGQVIYTNPFQGLRLADDEIAVATLLLAMASWCQGAGPPPYSLADASQDQLLSLAIENSIEIGQEVATGIEEWAS